MSSTIHHIWNPETGITDLPENWQSLAATELPSLAQVWKKQRDDLKDTAQLKTFDERMKREWAIETGIIEGIYEIDRGTTQTLIETGFRADLLQHGSTNKPKDFVISVLNDHKNALEGLFDFIKGTRELSTSYIKELHAALVRSQDYTDNPNPITGKTIQTPLLKGEWKKLPNFPKKEDITYHYCSPEQTASEMDKLVALHKKHEEQSIPAEIQAAWLHHRFTQIHPFQDGNGRVARTLASLVLIKAGLFPFGIPPERYSDYLDALEQADAGNLKPFIAQLAQLQQAQFVQATTAFVESVAKNASVEQALETLRDTAKHKQEQADIMADIMHVSSMQQKITTLTDVFGTRLQNLSSQLSEIFKGFDSNATNNLLHRSDGEKTSITGLSLNWEKKNAIIVFDFLTLGHTYNGSMVCKTSIEITPQPDKGHTSLHPFIFFHTEEQNNLIERFKPWLESVLAAALSELKKNL